MIINQRSLLKLKLKTNPQSVAKLYFGDLFCDHINSRKHYESIQTESLGANCLN